MRVGEEIIGNLHPTGTEKLNHSRLMRFFRQVFDRIPVEAVRDVLGKAVEKKLGIGD